MKSAIGVAIHCLLVVVNGVADAPLFQVEVTNAVEQRHINFLIGLVVSVEDFDVHRQRLVELLFQLELGRLFLELDDIWHQGRLSSARVVPGLGNAGGLDAQS